VASKARSAVSPGAGRRGKTGFLVSVGDGHGMASRLLEVLGDEVMRPEIKKRAAQDAALRFELEIMIAKYLHLYQTILQRQ